MKKNLVYLISQVSMLLNKKLLFFNVAISALAKFDIPDLYILFIYSAIYTYTWKELLNTKIKFTGTLIMSLNIM